MGFQTVVRRKELLKAVIVGAKDAWFKGRCFEPDSKLLHLLLSIFVARIPLPLLALSFGLTLVATRWSWEISRPFVFIIFVIIVVSFFIIFRGWFSAKLAFNVIHIHPNAIGFAKALLRHFTVIQP